MLAVPWSQDAAAAAVAAAAAAAATLRKCARAQRSRVTCWQCVRGCIQFAGPPSTVLAPERVPGSLPCFV
eukprot:3775157-Pyramimonas_sp.AAC.1